MLLRFKLRLVFILITFSANCVGNALTSFGVLSNSSRHLFTIDTEYGPVQGIQKTSLLSRNYFSFQSIPYMKAPLGNLRFRDPQPPEKWLEPLDATKEPPSYPCFNTLTQKLMGQEDAAVINVYTPYLEPSKSLPVLVYIHGGSFDVSLKFNGFSS